MKFQFSILAILQLIFLIRCFTVYSVKEEVIEEKLLESDSAVEQKQSIDLNNETINNQINISVNGGDYNKIVKHDKVKERIKIHYSFRMSKEYYEIKTSGKRWSRHFLFGLSDFAALFELITIPFRTMSDTKEIITEKESVTESTKVKDLDPTELSLIVRIQDQEFINTKLKVSSYSVSLKDIHRNFPQAESIEVLLYKKEERVAYKIIFIHDAIRRMLGN